MSKGGLVGQVLAGRFRIADLLGAGAMGEVYVAEHSMLGRQFAIKVLHESVENDERLVERFRREARAASYLTHPNIVSIIDFGRTEEDQLYLVMEYVPGQSLMDAINALKGGRMQFARAVSILEQLTSAVQAAHEVGVVHRDLKPDNVLLADGGRGHEQVKILDFGLAKMMQDSELSRLTRKGEIFGTPAYMSPEQARGDFVGPAADIYSIGVMAYELCAGRLPFLYNTIPRLLIAHQQEVPVPPSQHVRPGEWPIPNEIEAAILKCMAKEPAQRPSSVAELSSLFDHYAARARAMPSKVVPQVVLQEPADGEDGDSDWCEVTYDATGDAYTATLLGDEHVVEEIEPSEPPPGEAPEGASREWYWSQAVKKAKSLAHFLREQRLGTPELTRILGELADLEERTLSLDTEIALARSRTSELEKMTREAESRLRYAVMDLSMERGRLVDEGQVSSGVIQDLDFQIQSLESRLSEVYSERSQKMIKLEQSIRAREEHLVHYREQQVNAEARLVNTLHRSRPAVCPPDVQQGYLRLEDLLRAMQRAV